MYLQSGRMIVLREWCTGGQISTKKSYHTQLARKKVQIMTRVYLEKDLGNPKITPKKLIVKKPLERDGVGGNTTLT